MRALHSLARHTLPVMDHIRSWAAGGELQKGAVGQYLMGKHGAWHIVESEGQVTEQLLSAGSESLLSPAADTDEGFGDFGDFGVFGDFGDFGEQPRATD